SITWSNSILSCVAVMALFFCKVTLLRNNHARVCLKIVMGVSLPKNMNECWKELGISTYSARCKFAKN
ncbi:MAG: hypothetical protein PHI03_10885, partial [Bacteroidales bacterium]|nr:hypothetical protein [Bacteroidales bacterium]